MANASKPTNPKVVKLLVLAGLLVMFFPEWFGSIPFNVPVIVKDTVSWVFKGVDLTLMCWALFSGYDYKGSIYKRDQI